MIRNPLTRQKMTRGGQDHATLRRMVFERVMELMATGRVLDHRQFWVCTIVLFGAFHITVVLRILLKSQLRILRLVDAAHTSHTATNLLKVY
jgi:hypothetical protein